ncbi:MAG: hypothetical protein H6815_12200 [Phycisphaeraceae bacterium]|nr:hypothetical protein [Phycisphaeraceae bacterium]
MKINTIASVIAVTAAAHVAIAQTDTTFTYQGELNKLGAPVNDTCDFRFWLYDSIMGGNQVGPMLEATSVSVTDGRFSVDLNFGAAAFDNSGRWLGVEVRQPSGTGSYAVLTPRQPITRSPYSIQTRGIFVDSNKHVGIGTTTPEAPLHIRENSAGAVTAQANSTGVFERNGQNFISVLAPTSSERGILFGDPSNLANGGVVFNSPSVPNGMQFRTGGNVPQVYLNADGRLGIGTSTMFGQLAIADEGASSVLRRTHRTMCSPRSMHRTRTAARQFGRWERTTPR